MALPDSSTPRRAPAAEVVTRTRLPRQIPMWTSGFRRYEVPVEVGADELRVRFLLHGLGVAL